MEFFEKAHVSKNKNSSRKGNKSEENVKKELKQMLYGYHHSDNELIKKLEKPAYNIDDSSSVSGYSDLNLTNSSVEVDLPHEGAKEDPKDFHSASNNELSLDKSTSNAEADTSNSLSSESISEFGDDIKSLSEDISTQNLNDESDTASSGSEDDLDGDSFIVTSTDFDSSSHEESEFDADGTLAAKILEKIHIKKKRQNKKTKKRKLEDCDKEIDDLFRTSLYAGPYRPQESDSGDTEMDDLSVNVSNISLPEQDKPKGPYRPKSNRSEEINSSAENGSSSPDFVSVKANNMEMESLEDILGEYRNPTIRNLPAENQYTPYGDIFETENMSVVDLQDEDEVDSLIPEIDNNDVEEIVQDITDLEQTIDPVDESTTYDDAIQSEETSERELSTDSVDASLVNPVTVYYGKNQNCIFVLKHPAQIYIHGKVKIKCIGGTAEVLGYILRDQFYEVYAPNYNFAQYVATVGNPNVYYGLFSKLTSTGLTVSEAEDIVTTIGEYDVVLLMQPLKSRKIDFVENNFTVADLFTKQNKSVDNCFKKVSEKLKCSLYLSRPWKSFEENAIWKQTINCGLKPQSRGIICGGKGVGKSTFLRYYINKCLATRPVLVIDLDPGQSEFTVAGNVSATLVKEPLLGPNFTHLQTPDLTLHIGMINTMDNPKRYAAAVEALITHCYNDDRFRDIPWIINTMGMTNTIGLKFMTFIILHAKPTFLLQIDSKNPKKRYDFHLYPQTVKNLYFEDYQNDPLFGNLEEPRLEYEFFLSHHADNAVKNNFSLAPKEERYLNFLAYFGELLNMYSEDLLGIVPYEVSLKDISIGLNVKVCDEAVTKVINGKLVALCQPVDQDSRVFVLGDMPLRCFGVGLVRGVDCERELMYIVTPAGAAALRQAGALVYADWAPELRGPATAPPLPVPLPYRTASQYQQRRFMFAPKRRFNPLQLLKLSRNLN